LWDLQSKETVIEAFDMIVDENNVLLVIDICGNTDSNFFALDPKIVPKLGNLRFGNSKMGETG
jgi:hypothetical protein